MKQFNQILDDRIGTALTLAIAGSTIGGSVIGTAIMGLSQATVDQPIVSMVVGFLIIGFTTIVAGWYLPTDEEIARKVNARQWTDQKEN